MTNYARGATFERTVKADLEAKGYIVFRSAGSHGPYDLVALGPSEMLIQCKLNGKMSPKERAELCDAAHRAYVKPVKAWRPKRGTIKYEEVKNA